MRHRCTSFGMGDKDIPADGVVTGYGKIDGRTVFVYAQDFTAQGGSLGEMHAAKICKIMDMALEAGCPVVGLCDSRRRPHSGGGGCPVRLWADFLPQRLLFRTYPADLRHHGSLRGRRGLLPRPDGPDCHGGKGESDVYHGPAVVAATTGEEISAEDLGGADTHTTMSGVAHLSARSEEEALGAVRCLLSYLPSKAGIGLP